MDNTADVGLGRSPFRSRTDPAEITGKGSDGVDLGVPMRGKLIVLLLAPFSGYGADYKEYVRNWSSSGSWDACIRQVQGDGSLVD